MDPRDTPFNGRVAHVSLKGRVTAEQFVDGEWFRVAVPVADLLTSPNGSRTRQLVYGQGFCVVDMSEGFAFGYALRDGYCGWVNAADFAVPGSLSNRTHRVIVPRAFGLPRPDVKATGQEVELSFGSEVALLNVEGDWARVPRNRGTNPSDMFLPATALAPVETSLTDPAATAEFFLHTPYLWGGNSAFGIDCSGLVQAALLASGQPCPGDSDQQEQQVGSAFPEGATVARNDLIFWKGHVALALDCDRIIHANAHHMAVAIEPLADAKARILEAGGGEVTSIRRP
ncbi:MAG: NlpC/P60 family protein [Pseudomonadota bacterium]